MILIVKGVAKVSKKGSTIVVSVPKRSEDKSLVWETQQIPLLDLETLVIVGSRVRVSSGVLLMLSEAGVPVLVHGRRGDSFLMNPFNVRIAEVRRRLYAIQDNPLWRLSIGKAFIEGKILGMVNLARYLTYKEAEKNRDASQLLQRISDIEEAVKKEISDINSMDGLRLFEAKYSKMLWEILGTFIPAEYQFTGRDPKSRDPMNSAISYTYAIIYGLCTHALIAAGLDPYVGIIHVERAGRTSLTYDFSEMFKPIAIHATIVASRQVSISTDNNGYLTTKSLEVLSKHMYRLLRKKHEKWRYDARGEIYAKALELRENIEKGRKFEPFIYRIK